MNGSQKQNFSGRKPSFLVGFVVVLAAYSVTLAISLFFTIDDPGVFRGIIAILIVITALIIYVFISRILWPIRKLIDAMDEFSTGSPFIKIKESAFGEVGALVAVFNHMRDRFNQAYVELGEKIKIQTRELDLKISEIEGNNKILQETQTALLNVLEDIDKEKRNSQILAADLQKFRLAVDNASDHIIITDPDAKLLYANHAAEIITGYSVGEMTGKTPALWGGQMPSEFYKQMWNMIKNKKLPFIGELENRRKNGEIYIAELKISPILDDSGQIKFYVGIERDITKAKEIDRAKTEFVSLASHQLRTPLSIINWYSEMLLQGDAGKIASKQKSYVDEIHQTNRRMINLVNALLDVSKIDMGTFPIEISRVNLREISDSVLRDLMPQITLKKIIIEKDYEATLLDIEADQKIIRIIVQNLLSNAIKYSKNGGRVVIALKRQDQDASIRVSDNGIGIPSDQQAKIFTKLFRADNAREIDPDGNGLGLYLVKSLVKEIGGRIWFDSVEGKGTIFFVSLPFKSAIKKVQ
jgi:PAS domain S-box-containing protein